VNVCTGLKVDIASYSVTVSITHKKLSMNQAFKCNKHHTYIKYVDVAVGFWLNEN